MHLQGGRCAGGGAGPQLYLAQKLALPEYVFSEGISALAPFQLKIA